MAELLIPLIRGFKEDKFDNDLSIKNEYLILSTWRANRFFNQNTTSNLKDYDIYPNDMLDGFNFWMKVNTKESYLRTFLKAGSPICLDYPLPEWAGRSILAHSEDEKMDHIRYLVSHFEGSATSGELTDVFIRLQSIFPCLEHSYDMYKHIYITLNNPLQRTNLDISFHVNDVSIETKPDKYFKGVFKCTAQFRENRVLRHIEFDLYAFSPYAVYLDEEFHQRIFPPHVIVGKVKSVEEIKKYILYTLNFIKASTEKELLLKLCVFTDSINSKPLISEVLYSGLKFNIKLDYFSVGNNN